MAKLLKTPVVRLNAHRKPKCVLITTKSGKVEMPNVSVKDPLPEGLISRLAGDVFSAATAGRYKRTPRGRRFSFLDIRAAFMSPAFLHAIGLMNDEEYKDLVDLVQRLAASDDPRLYMMDGRQLKVRIKIEDPGFGELQCPIFATFSRRADAVVFYSHGRGDQFLEWARRYHPENKNLIAACDLLHDESILLIAKITTFSARPDLITKFKLY